MRSMPSPSFLPSSRKGKKEKETGGGRGKRQKERSGEEEEETANKRGRAARRARERGGAALLLIGGRNLERRGERGGKGGLCAWSDNGQRDFLSRREALALMFSLHELVCPAKVTLNLLATF